MVRVRSAAPGDAPLILSILRSCGLPAEGLETADGPDAGSALSAGRSFFFVAEAGGAAAGVIGLELYPPRGLLRSAAVLEEHRKRGIGRVLVDEVIRKAREESLSELVLLTEGAAGYFRRRGFRAVGRESLEGPILEAAQLTGSRCASASVMVMSLEPGADPAGPP